MRFPPAPHLPPPPDERSSRMTTLIELEPTVTVAENLLEFVALEGDVANTCKKAIAGKNYKEFISSLLSSPDALFGNHSSADVINIFNIVSHLLSTQVAPADQAGLAQSVCASVISSADNIKTRLRILVGLYNLMSQNNDCSTQVAKELLKYATANKHVHLISQSINTIVSHMESGSASVEDLRDIFYLGHCALESTGMNEEAQQMLLRYLATYEGQDASGIKDRAAKCVVGAIKLPFLSFTGPERSRVSTLGAVKLLENDSTYGPLYKLLVIFMRGDMKQFNDFIGDNESALENFGFDAALCSEKMRLLTLCSIASGADELQYSTVAWELQIDEDAVEDWVIRGIMEKLLEAKLDQVEKLIVVNRAMPRTFGDKQWEGLTAKLKDWKSNVRQLLNIVQSAQQ